MDFALIGRLLGFLLICLSLTQLPSAGICLFYGEPHWRAFVSSALFSVLAGGALFLLLRPDRRELSHREAFAVAGLGWILACVVGALPYLFSGLLPNFMDALFESASGFTTTGATVVSNVEILPKGLLFWRSLTHWLGGMGIILLSVAILPMLGVGGMQLYRAEVPGPVVDRLKPRIRETAKTLWIVYVGISALEALLLWLGPMNGFEAICHTFGTLATGGFSTRNESIGAYHSAYVEWVVIFFMFVAGANFALHYQFLTGTRASYLRDPEFRLYLFLLFAGGVFIASLLVLDGKEALPSGIRHAVFQVTSILTTTGYTTVDYEQWPGVAQYVLFLLMFVGGCAGSTGGGMKCVRLLLLLKQAYRAIYQHIHPHAIFAVKLGQKTVSEEVMQSVLAFSVLFLAVFVLATGVLCGFGMDFRSAMASVVACLGNVGPGLGVTGPAETYGPLSQGVKGVLVFCMVLGRLELFTLVVLFIPEFWKK
jgi:trk system potassium uptake protein TrkH